MKLQKYWCVSVPVTWVALINADMATQTQTQTHIHFSHPLPRVSMSISIDDWCCIEWFLFSPLFQQCLGTRIKKASLFNWTRDFNLTRGESQVNQVKERRRRGKEEEKKRKRRRGRRRELRCSFEVSYLLLGSWFLVLGGFAVLILLDRGSHLLCVSCLSEDSRLMQFIVNSSVPIVHTLHLPHLCVRSYTKGRFDVLSKWKGMKCNPCTVKKGERTFHQVNCLLRTFRLYNLLGLSLSFSFPYDTLDMSWV